MGIRAVLTRLAGGAPQPVFAVAGEGGLPALRRLALVEGIELVSTPRAASTLLIVGRIPDALNDPLRQIHDQLARPRHTVVWGEQSFSPLPRATLVAPGEDPIPALGQRDRDHEAGEAPAMPDADPHPWRGVGPYGQGGRGMTGGTPFGRALTGRADDRDGLTLDQLPLAVGPFFPALPSGLVLHVKLQGDLVQDVSVGENPFTRRPGDPPLPAADLALFERALSEPVPIAALELARAAHHLWWLGQALAVHGLAALGHRAWRLAADVADVADGPAPFHAAEALSRRFDRLEIAVRCSRVLSWAIAGADSEGHGLPLAVVASRGLGPVARAAGQHEDARQLDPAYRALGFQPVVHSQGDTASRWRQRLAEIRQSLQLAGAAAEAQGPTSTPSGLVESPRGPITPAGHGPSHALMSLVADLVRGLEWGDAVAAVTSLDLDMAEAARPVGAGVAV